MIEAFLSHYGKKGMRWGSKSQSSAPPSLGTRKYNAKNLSNKELASVVKRMELEQKYSELNKKGAVKSQGGNAVKKFLAKNGDKVAGIVIAGAATAAVKAFLESPKAGVYLNKLKNIGP